MVTNPPMADASARGINTKEAERFILSEDRRATGIIKARAPTLFMKADKIAAITQRMITYKLWYFAATVIFRTIKATAPERVMT